VKLVLPIRSGPFRGDALVFPDVRLVSAAESAGTVRWPVTFTKGRKPATLQRKRKARRKA
jgi:hypothetical protein